MISTLKCIIVLRSKKLVSYREEALMLNLDEVEN